MLVLSLSSVVTSEGKKIVAQELKDAILLAQPAAQRAQKARAARG